MKKILFFLISFFFLTIPAAHAQQAAITIINPTQEIQLTKGQVYTGFLSVRNRTDTASTVQLNANDFVVRDNLGTPVIFDKELESNRFAAASWISFPEPTMIIGPRQEVQIPYVVHTPANAAPGGHYVALIVKNISAGLSNSSGATITVQAGALLSLTVAGAIEEKALVSYFSVAHFQENGPFDIGLLLTNKSDVHIKPVGTIIVRNFFGQKVRTFDLPLKNIFPDASRMYSFLEDDSVLFGPYTVTLEATYGSKNFPLTARAVIWILPWKILILIVLALIALALGVLVLRKKNPPTVIEITKSQPLSSTHDAASSRD